MGVHRCLFICSAYELIFDRFLLRAGARRADDKVGTFVPTSRLPFDGSAQLSMNMNQLEKNRRVLDGWEGVDTMTAMKIISHKSEKMHRRYNQISPADLHQAVGKLVTYQADQSSDA